jgi:hypothetical protein
MIGALLLLLKTSAHIPHSNAMLLLVRPAVLSSSYKLSKMACASWVELSMP